MMIQDEVSVEGETGKMYRAGFHDRQGRTVLILRPGMQVSWFHYRPVWIDLFDI